MNVIEIVTKNHVTVAKLEPCIQVHGGDKDDVRCF